MAFRVLARGVVGVLVWLISTALALACTVPPDYRTDIRPNAGDGPTVITASMGVADFMGVDDVNQRLELDMIVQMGWQDDRLIGLEGCRFAITQVWFPPVLLFNSSNLRAARTQARNQVIVGENGKIAYGQRATGFISSYHNLRQFPFDRQFFQIGFGSLRFGVDDLTFIPDPENTWIARRLNIEGWDVFGVSLSNQIVDIQESNLTTDVLTLTIEAKRSTDFYVYRVIMLLLFVVAMSWAIFWVPPKRFEFQIGLGATSMLTAIAFNLSISSQLPQLGYLTILDKMLIWAIILIFLSIVEALWAGLMVLEEREALALRLDRISRVVFPLLLAVGWLLIINRGLSEIVPPIIPG
ncbi:MAG: hypothetical protein HRU32_02400 [Rhodobacteraceae bacterium]|nr:hypothetical protein [Paracoccaceae bacterium]